jgi:hypothetical protein
VLWNQGVHTDREVMANRPAIIIKNKRKKHVHTGKCGNTSGQKYHAKKEAENKLKYKTNYIDSPTVHTTT